jgi:aspartate aminotransferase-like enzyme
MIPGPSEPYPDTVASLSKPVLPHYGPEWKTLYDNTCSDLKKLFNTENEVIIVPACGNSGLELAVANLLEPGDKVLLVNNGFFGEMLKEIIIAYDGSPLVASAKFGEAIDMDTIKDVLERENNVKAIFSVYNETSTGVINNIVEIGKIAKEYNLFNVVDAISAFGGMELNVDKWNIDICIGYPSKSLGAIMGSTPVSISKKVWDYNSKRESKIRTRFLSLKLWRKCIDQWASWGHPFPTSMPTSNIYALKIGLEIALKEGLKNRYLRHKICKRAVREGISSLGISPFVFKEEDASNTLTSMLLPEKVNFADVISNIKNNFNIMIGSMNLIGVNGLRIAHMGLTASPHYILPTLFALETTLHKLGFNINKGEALRKAGEIFAKYS